MNLLLKGFNRFSARSFHRLEKALASPREAQLRTLKQIVALSSRVHTPTLAAFQCLPMQSYEDLSALIESSVAGEQHLTHHTPFNFEPTSGSSGARKFIPYTRPLIQSFTEMFLCWGHDLLTYGPRFEGGQVYFSVSPQFHQSAHGLSDDADYLSGVTAWFFRRFAAAPTALKQLSDPEQFYTALAACLLCAPQLEIISVWSPTFLLTLLEHIETHRQDILRLCEAGELVLGKQRYGLRPLSDDKRAALQEGDLSGAVLFPHLKLISTWGAQNAAPGFKDLQKRFPQTLVQEKGLLATEAPLTVPSQKYKTFLPILTEVFFEFVDAQGQVFLIDELQEGQTYEVVISQKSGLLRYRLKDRVKVIDRVAATPCFHFVGRTEDVSDLVGEKLNQDFVQGIVDAYYPDDYLCLLPDLARYTYWLLSTEPIDTAAFEAHLMSSPHYHNARQLGQLGPLKQVSIPHLPQELKRYFVQCRHMNLGDIKDKLLYTRENDGALLRFLTTA